MALIQFQNLDLDFQINDDTITEYSSTEDQSTLIFGLVSTGGDEVEFHGSGLTYAAGLPTGGTVDEVRVDINNDDAGLRQINITGLNIAATAFNFNVGDAETQNNRIWRTILAGDDTLTFNLADFTIDLWFAGDGSDIATDTLHIGGSDTFNSAGSAVGAASVLAGDYITVEQGQAVGGADVMNVGSWYTVGDFLSIASGASGIGGDDTLAPEEMGANATSGMRAHGDAWVVSGTLVGGDDVIDLRSTDFTGFAFAPFIFGDVDGVGSTGVLIGGRDTIHGSDLGESIWGDWSTNTGYGEGGRDRILGNGGNDTIFGNSGRDLIDGGDGNDSIDGGLDGDFINAGLGNDTLIGDTGNDSLSGDEDDDFFVAGSGRDTIVGGSGDDSADGGAGNDSMLGGTGRDNFFGGNGDDYMSGDAGNDTLSGGDLNDTLLGGNGFDLLIGGNDNDYLDGGGSNDNLYGNTGVDTFNFTTNAGVDTIKDFVAGAGANDFIRLQGFGFAFDSFAEIIAVASDDGSDTTFSFGNGTTIIVENAVVADFNADDFIFG